MVISSTLKLFKNSLLIAGLFLLINYSCKQKQSFNTDIYFQKILDFKYVNTDSLGTYLSKLDSLYEALSPEKKSYLLSFKAYFNHAKSKTYLAKNNFQKTLEIALPIQKESIITFCLNRFCISF